LVITCDKWADGSWWVATVPKFWTVKEAEGYYFTSPSGCELRLGFRKHPELIGPWDYPLPSDDMTESEIISYKQTKLAASKYNVNEVYRYELGMLIGYTYISDSDDGVRWRGFFSYNDWSVFVNLLSDKKQIKEDMIHASNIISSLQFFA